MFCFILNCSWAKLGTLRATGMYVVKTSWLCIHLYP